MSRLAARVDALLLDFGNVIVPIDFHRAFDVWARAAGASPADIATRFSFDGAYEAHERGEIEGAQYLRSLRGSLGAALSDQQLLAGWNAIFLEPAPGMHDLLRTLAAAMPLYLFSNTNVLHHAYWRKRYRRLLESFTGIFCSHQLGLRKPSPAAFERVVQVIGITPSRLAFFDDAPENINGARKAGLLGFHVTSMAELRQALINDLRLPAVPGGPLEEA